MVIMTTIVSISTRFRTGRVEEESDGFRTRHGVTANTYCGPWTVRNSYFIRGDFGRDEREKKVIGCGGGGGGG